jgi:hypothetical protein
MTGYKLENRLGHLGFGQRGPNQERHHYEQRTPRWPGSANGIYNAAHEWCPRHGTTNRSPGRSGPGQDTCDYQPRTPGH